MRKIKVKVLKSTQKNRVGVQETLEHLSNTSGGGSHGGGGDKPRPPRGPSRIERVEKTLITFIDEQRKFNKSQQEFNQIVIKRLDEQGNNLQTIQSDINELKVRMTKVEKRLDRVDDILEYNVQVDVLKTPK